MPKQPPPFDPEGYHRARQILKPEGAIPVSPSTWWRWTREGRLPPLLRLGAALTVWRGEDLNRAHLPRHRASAR
jgi:predicted DNA-binding transcriptional regulator AlpA